MPNILDTKLIEMETVQLIVFPLSSERDLTAIQSMGASLDPSDRCRSNSCIIVFKSMTRSRIYSHRLMHLLFCKKKQKKIFGCRGVARLSA